MDQTITATNQSNQGIQPSSIPPQKPSVQPVQTVRSSSVSFEYEQEIAELSRKVEAAQAMPPGLLEKARKMISRLQRGAKMGNFSKEYEGLERYVDWITRVPWGAFSNDNLDLENARQLLDKTHFGLDKVKNLILEYISVMKMRTDKAGSLSNISEQERDAYAKRAPIVLFVGLQGVGKTSIAKSIATAMNRQIVRISLGAMSDISQIRGTSRTSADAEPGQIVKALIRAGTMNPIIIFDEIDKVSGDKAKNFDMNAVMLEILDPEQNDKFLDYYLDYPVDLSKIMFIATANNLGTLSTALLDRLEVIRFTSYTDDEKMVIAKTYLWPRVLETSGFAESQISFQEEVWKQIIRPLGFDSGIRQLERTLNGVARKAAKRMLEEKTDHVAITTENIKQFLPDDLGTLS